MSVINFKAGWVPHPEGVPKPELTDHLTSQPHSEGSLLGAVNYWGKVANWGMLLNDKLGCCVFAGDGHIAIQQTAYGMGQAAGITDNEVLKAYEAVGGYRPGYPSTDRGSTCQHGLDYLRKQGMAGFKIAAYGHVDPKNHDAVRRAIEDFGCLDVGMLVSKMALQQNGAGAPWTTVADDGGIEGGHCVVAVGYDLTYVYVVTWGHVQKMTWAFWDKYVDESWAPISEAWTSVTGLDLIAFGQEFAVAFACRNPFAPPVSPVQAVEAEVSKWYHRFFVRGAHAR